MVSNRLNTGELQFTCLGTRYQVYKVDSSVFVVSGAAVNLLRTVTCLGVSIDQELEFADHIRSLTWNCSYWITETRTTSSTGC